MEADGYSWFISGEWLNKCWFHACLHLLTCVPRVWSLSSDNHCDFNELEKSFLNALYATFYTHRPSAVSSFFGLVKDFMGQNNRYGQVAAPDFLDYLCSQSSKVNQAVSHCYITRLQCSQCQWVSEVPSSDTSLNSISLLIVSRHHYRILLLTTLILF